jgi:hypothetical protein
VAIRQLKTDLISFFDVDDVMHPQRLEAVCLAFQSYPETQIVLHSYTEPHESQTFESYSTIELKPNTLKRAPSGCAIYEPNWRAKIHHSQATVASSIPIRFHEEASYERREDALYCGEVLSLPSCQNVYLPQSFSLYFMEGATHAV